MALQLIVAGNDKVSQGYAFYYLKKSAYKLYKKRYFSGNVFLYLNENKQWEDKTLEFNKIFRRPEAIYFYNRHMKKRHSLGFFDNYKIRSHVIDVTGYHQNQVEQTLSLYIDVFADNNKVVILKTFSFENGIPSDTNFIIDLRAWGISGENKKRHNNPLVAVNSFLKQQNFGFPLVIGVGSQGNTEIAESFSEWLAEKIHKIYDVRVIDIK